jgi:uncharacterized Ntn-hydrolase superfamily protein
VQNSGAVLIHNYVIQHRHGILTTFIVSLYSLKKQLSASLAAARLAPGSPGGRREAATALSADERRALEERAASVRADLDARRANIQELRRRLEKTHVTE